MARKGFLYFLFNENKLPQYVDDNGHIQEGDGNFKKPDGQTAKLKFDPEGWKDTLVKYARNLKYMGLFRDMTVPIKFPRDGKKILKNAMWNAGIEAICYLGILKLDRFNLPYNYKSWYISELNFVKYKESRNYVTIEALEGGPSKYIKAFENTDYDIPCDEVTIKMDGAELDNSALFAITDGLSVNPLDYVGNHVVDAQVVSKEIGDIGGVYDAKRTKVNNLNSQIRATKQYIFKATANGVLHAEWNFTVQIIYNGPPGINPAAVAQVQLRRIDENDFSNFFLQLLVRNTSTGIPGTYNLVGSGDIAMAAGQELYLYTFINPTGAGGDANTVFNYSGDEPFLKLNYTYRHPESVVDAITPFTLADRVVKAMSEGMYGVKSDFLNSLRDEYLLSSGDALRGIPGSFIRTSLAKYFKSFNSRFSIALGVEGDYVRIEPLSYFFKDTVIYDVGDVVNAELTFADDLAFNTIKAGYKEQEYKEINGRNEINQGQVWTTPVTRYTKELDLSSDYRADMLGAELMRINWGQRRTTDTGSDNDTWFLHVKKQFSTFTAITNFSATFNEMYIPGEGARAINFPAGMRYRVSGTGLNNGVYKNTNTFTPNSGADLQLFPASNLFDENNILATFESLSYILNRPVFTNVVGLNHPNSAFNVMLRPKIGLINNGQFIRSMLDLMDNKFIKLVSSDRNIDLETTINGLTIKENEPLQIGTLGDKLFRPYYITFTTKVPVNLVEVIKGEAYGKIKFFVNGHEFYGFLFDGGIKPATMDSQQWKLLSASENDFKLFSHE